MSGFVIKDCSIEASLGWKCFGTYSNDRQFYTFNDKYLRESIRKSIKEGRLAALNKYFDSNKCEEILNTMKS